MPAPRSDLAAAHHLLRNINDARALRVNALAIPYLESSYNRGTADARQALARLRARVVEFVESLGASTGDEREDVHGQRQRAIVARFDLEGHSLEAVARDLAIEKSQFYAERRVALGRLAQAIEMGSDSIARPQAETTDSIDVLETLVAEISDDERLLVPLSQLVERLCAEGRVGEAQRAFQRMTRVVAALEPNDKNRLEFDFAASWLATYTENAELALPAAERVCQRLLQADRLSRRETHMLGSCASAVAYFKVDESGAAGVVDLLSDVASALERLGDLTEPAYAKLLSRLAAALGQIPGRMREALRYSKRCLDLAHRCAEPAIVVLAHYTESRLRFYCGHVDLARAHMDLAQTLANAFLEPRLAIRITVGSAELAAWSGQSERALAQLDNSALERDDQLWAIAEATRSRALSSQGHFAAAETHARSACESTESARSSIALGRALTAAAIALEGLGQRRKAIATIEEALALLGRIGHAYDLADACAWAALLTNQGRYAGTAAQLYEALRIL